MVSTKEVKSMLVSLHEQFPVRVTDWLLSAILLSWGVALFSVSPAVWNLPTFSGLSVIATQLTWAATATFIGLGRVAALFINGAVRRSPHARALGAGLSIFIWVQLSLGVVFSDQIGPGIAIFPWLALADMLNVYRACNDAKVSDIKARDRRRAVVARDAQRA